MPGRPLKAVHEAYRHAPVRQLDWTVTVPPPPPWDAKKVALIGAGVVAAGGVM